MRFQVALVGASSETASPEQELFAEQLGYEVALQGWVLLCGGRDGVMQAACRGVERGQGLSVAILPGQEHAEANPYAGVVLPTGLGFTRNALVALSGQAVVALGGGAGTLSEVAMAWQFGRPVIAVAGIGGWSERLAGTALDARRGPIDTAYQVEDVIRHLSAIAIKEGSD